MGESAELVRALKALNWSPRILVRELNILLNDLGLGSHTVSNTAAYHWLAGRCPYNPLPELIAHLLSERLAEQITPHRLWPTRPVRDPELVPADAGLCVPWTPEGTMKALADWERRRHMLSRRRMLAISGVALTGPAAQFLDAEPAQLTAAVHGTDRVTPQLMGILENGISGLRKLDHSQGGGGGALRLAGHTFTTLSELLRHGSYTDRIGQRMYRALAEAAQIAGYMAFDGEQHPLAQRYWLIALRAAHSGSDQAQASKILGCMSAQAVSRGIAREAIHLAGASVETSAHQTPTVQAFAATRLACAHAGAGDAAAFRMAHEKARDLAEAHNNNHDNPAWAHWITPSHIDGITGSYIVDSARTNPRSRLLLNEAQALLSPWSHADGKDGYGRDAVLCQTRLALAYTWQQEAEEACRIGHRALTIAAGVDSPRCNRLLTHLRHDLVSQTRTRRVPAVEEFRAEADRALRIA